MAVKRILHSVISCFLMETATAAQRTTDKAVKPGLRTHRVRSWFLAIIPVLLLIFMLILSKPFTVVRLDERGKDDNGIEIYFVDGDFKPDEIVDSIWDSRALPTILEEAIDLPTLLDELARDPQTACTTYGHYETQEISSYSFIVKGEGQVTTVDTTSRNGTMAVDIPPYDKKPDVTIQIGPVIKGTSIRDSLDFISFGQFTNQLEFARISNALNARVVNIVLRDLQSETVTGKLVSFYGAFTLANPDDFSMIIITPVQIEVTEGD